MSCCYFISFGIISNYFQAIRSNGQQVTSCSRNFYSSSNFILVAYCYSSRSSSAASIDIDQISCRNGNRATILHYQYDRFVRSIIATRFNEVIQRDICFGQNSIRSIFQGDLTSSTIISQLSSNLSQRYFGAGSILQSNFQSCFIFYPLNSLNYFLNTIANGGINISSNCTGSNQVCRISFNLGVNRFNDFLVSRASPYRTSQGSFINVQFAQTTYSRTSFSCAIELASLSEGNLTTIDLASFFNKIQRFSIFSLQCLIISNFFRNLPLEHIELPHFFFL